MRGRDGSRPLGYDPLPVRNAIQTDQDRYVIAFNPSSGKGISRARAEALVEALTAAGADVTVCETCSDRNVFVECAEDAGVRAIVVLGGDGTLHEAANALADHPVSVLFCGTGTVNVFGVEFGLDSSVAGWVDALRIGRMVRMPLLQATPDRRFLMFAEVGFLGRAVARVNERRRRTGRHGRSEFVGAFLMECFSSWGRPVRVCTESASARRGPYSNVLITRSRRYADRGLIPIDPEVEAPLLEDAFYVVGYRSRTPLGHLLATAIVAGGLLPRLRKWVGRIGLIDVFRATELCVETTRAAPCHLDAETLVADRLDVRARGTLGVIIPG